jgi:hypothetical protein
MIVEFLPVPSIALGAIERNCGRMQETGSNAGLISLRLTQLPYDSITSSLRHGSYVCSNA